MAPISLFLRQEFVDLPLEYSMLVLEDLFHKIPNASEEFYPSKITLERHLPMRDLYNSK